LFPFFHFYLTDTPVSSKPHVDDCPANGQDGWRFMSIWTPGAEAVELPTQAGFPLEGSHYVVQVHYENIQHPQGHHDSSGFDLRTTDQLRPTTPTCSCSVPSNTVATRCAWLNPESDDVTYGESVGYQMCSVYTIYYPKVTAVGWHWQKPETQSKCHLTP
jgi:hypothetical protein